ncbi:MAG: hypothetical protein IJ542_00535 [Clostridia bacterium]|nr:hypothetical protein [Clostridia bacterium]
MDFFSFESFVKKLDRNYFNINVVGKSVLKQNIYSISTKFKTKHVAIITAAIHAREHISCDVVCKMIELLQEQRPILQYNVIFVPLLNPDGANFCKNGLKNADKCLKKHLISINNCENFELFKANANGVDLNNNFDANWHNQFSKRHSPSPQGYYGKRPFSEPETVALKKLTERLRPFLTISYHLKGEEIYYDFFQCGKRRERDKKIAEIFAKNTGYKIVATQSVSSGGYKDWCVQKLKIPALTIELGDDKFSHPYPESEIDNIFEKNKGVFDCISHALLVYNEFGEDNGRKIYEKSSCARKASLRSR